MKVMKLSYLNTRVSRKDPDRKDAILEISSLACSNKLDVQKKI